MKLIYEKLIGTFLFIVVMLLSGDAHSECLPDQKLPLGSKLEWFDQSYLVSDLAPLDFDPQYSEREIPAEEICPEEPVMTDSSLRLLFINQQLSLMTLERIGKFPLWAEWVVTHYGGDSEGEVELKDNLASHEHFVLVTGGQVTRYFRMPLDGGELLERVEFEGQNLMQDRWQQLLDEEAMGR